MRAVIENGVVRFYPNGKPQWKRDPLADMEALRVRKMRLIAFTGFMFAGLAFWVAVAVWLASKIL